MTADSKLNHTVRSEGRSWDVRYYTSGPSGGSRDQVSRGRRVRRGPRFGKIEEGMIFQTQVAPQVGGDGGTERAGSAAGRMIYHPRRGGGSGSGGQQAHDAPNLPVRAENGGDLNQRMIGLPQQATVRDERAGQSAFQGGGPAHSNSGESEVSSPSEPSSEGDSVSTQASDRDGRRAVRPLQNEQPGPSRRQGFEGQPTARLKIRVIKVIREPQRRPTAPFNRRAARGIWEPQEFFDFLSEMHEVRKEYQSNPGKKDPEFYLYHQKIINHMQARDERKLKQLDLKSEHGLQEAKTYLVGVMEDVDHGTQCLERLKRREIAFLALRDIFSGQSSLEESFRFFKVGWEGSSLLQSMYTCFKEQIRLEVKEVDEKIRALKQENSPLNPGL